MLQVDNQTPFEVALTPLPNEEGIDTLYLTMKATFALAPGRSQAQITVAEEQTPLLASDAPWGEPGASSLRYAGEVHLAKPATDVVLIGSAQRRDRRKAEELDVRLRVGPVTQRARVSGDRVWKGGLLAPRIGPPKPFESMPLLWEHAFGGLALDEEGEPVDGEARNPVGRGFTRRGERGQLVDTLLPNVENPAQLVSKASDRPAPVGFGFVAPHWQPRSAYAGTYDERWRRTRAPYLPEDFDLRFFSAAPPGLICPGFLTGGEPVELDHGWRYGALRARLPAAQVAVIVERSGETHRPPLQLETVLLEPDEDRLTLLWRAALRCDKSLLQVSRATFLLRSLDLARRRAA